MGGVWARDYRESGGCKNKSSGPDCFRIEAACMHKTGWLRETNAGVQEVHTKDEVVHLTPGLLG